MQKVLVVQRDGLGAGKIAEVKKLSDDLDIRVIDVNGPFLPIPTDPDLRLITGIITQIYNGF